MKKIVGIMAAAAMAASMFAVDFSAGVRLDGDLFTFDANGNSISVLKERHDNEFYHKPISFAVNGDRAGGQLKLTDKNADTVKTDAWSIWFKPVESLDGLKVTVGRWSTNLNQEHIGWCNTDSGIESDGYALSFASGAFSADLFLASKNDAYFITKKDGADLAVGELAAKVQFGADFATINALFNAKDTFKAMRFGAGINMKGLPVGLWANVLGFVTDDAFQEIRVEADVSGKAGALGYEAFVAGGYKMKGGDVNTFTGVESWHVGGAIAAEKAFVGLLAKVTYPIGALGAYVEIKDSNFLADNFSMTVKPGFTTNVGACAINCAVEATIQEKVKIAVPVEFAFGF